MPGIKMNAEQKRLENIYLAACDRFRVRQYAEESEALREVRDAAWKVFEKAIEGLEEK